MFGSKSATIAQLTTSIETYEQKIAQARTEADEQHGQATRAWAAERQELVQRAETAEAHARDLRSRLATVTDPQAAAAAEKRLNDLIKAVETTEQALHDRDAELTRLSVALRGASEELEQLRGLVAVQQQPADWPGDSVTGGAR